MKTILVTRPKNQAQALCEALRAKNFNTIEFPTLDIIPLFHARSPFEDASYDFLIFTSSNAVEQAKAYLPERKQRQTNVAAIGPATASHLQAIHYAVDIMPEVFNSESLLACLRRYPLKDKSILLITGVGGRGLLDKVLKAEGALVNRFEVYRRAKPHQVLTSALLGQVDIILSTSREALENLYQMTPENLRSRLFNIKLIVTSSRLLSMAVQLGFNDCAQATNATTPAVLTALSS